MRRWGRLVALMFLALVLLGSVVSLGLVWRRARKSNVEYWLAETAMDRQDWLGARIMLGRILRRDPSSERAMKMMIDVVRAEDNPELEAHWLGRAMKLNEFEQSYAADYRRALLRLRAFGRYGEMVSALPASARTADDEAWLVMSKHYTASIPEARRAWETWKKERPAGPQSDVVKMVDTVFGMNGKTAGELYTNLVALTTSANEAVRQETLLAVGEMEVSANRLDDAEKRFSEVAKMNYHAGMPLLIRLRLFQGRLEDSVRLNGEYLKRFPTLRRAIIQAELLTAAKRNDLLPDIAKLFKGQDYATISFKSYLKALEAYGKGDMEALENALLATRKTIHTPWSFMMSATATAALGKPDMLTALERDWAGITHSPAFFRCRESTYAVIKNTLKRELLKGTPATALASLAAALQGKDPDREDVDLTHILVLAGLQGGTVTREALAGVIKRHPSDPGILQLAAESALAEDDGPAAIEYARRLRQTGTNVTAAASLAMRGAFTIAVQSPSNATARANATSGMKAFFAEVKEPLPIDITACWWYVNQLPGADDLRLLQRVSTNYAPFCAVMLLELEGKKAEALDAAETLPTTDPELVYWTALRLAKGDRNRAAIARYESLPADFENHIGALLNLSELYAAEGQSEKALALAKEAWEKVPHHPQVQTCYACRLFAKGDLAKIREIVRLAAVRSRVNPRLLEVWVPAMEDGIKADWAKGNQFVVRDAARQLLRYAPDNAVAKDHLAKFEAWQAEQKAAKAKEKDKETK